MSNFTTKNVAMNVINDTSKKIINKYCSCHFSQMLNYLLNICMVYGRWVIGWIMSTIYGWGQQFIVEDIDLQNLKPRLLGELHVNNNVA